jgi:hypothetical protein
MTAAESSAMPMLEHALEYLKLGYPVFPICSPLMGQHQHGGKPCTSPGKRPLVAWEPYQSRLPTEAEVRRWWSSEPRANIGLATGALSGVIVLDCDSGEARSLAMEKGGLDRTPAVWTGKPGGIHYWLEHPGEDVRNFARRLPGTDLRGDGGYVLLPPSRHVSGADYRWNEHTLGMQPKPVPPWLGELLRGGSGAAASDESGDHEPLDLTAILNGIGQGARDDTLYRYACKMRGDNVPQAYAEQMIRQAARLCKPAFDEDEAVGKVTNAYKDFQPNADWSSLLDDDEETVEARVAEEPLPQPFLRPISELLAMPEVEPDWLVNQLFTVGSNGWVAAEPKVGKSWTVLELVYALSTGSPFLGRFAVKQPRRVMYIQEEDSLQRVLRRLKKLLKGDPSREPPSDEYLRWSIRSGFKLDSQEWLNRLQDELRAYPAEVVVLDVFNMLHGMEENKQADMTSLLQTMMTFNRIFGCAFIVVHHNRKPQAGNEARGNQMIRGSGVLAGWGECSLYLRRSKEKNTIIVTPESKDCPEMDDFTVTIQDTDNGGVVLELGDVEPIASMTKGDAEAIDAVRTITKRGIGATVQTVAGQLGKDRTTIQRRLTKLVEAGYLSSYAISDAPKATQIYEVVEQ